MYSGYLECTRTGARGPRGKGTETLRRPAVLARNSVRSPLRLPTLSSQSSEGGREWLWLWNRDAAPNILHRVGQPAGAT